MNWSCRDTLYFVPGSDMKYNRRFPEIETTTLRPNSKVRIRQQARALGNNKEREGNSRVDFGPLLNLDWRVGTY